MELTAREKKLLKDWVDSLEAEDLIAVREIIAKGMKGEYVKSKQNNPQPSKMTVRR